MGIYCVASPGGAAGATTTALALALSWGRQVLLVEADPGGRRILPGFMADQLDGPAGPGLLGLAMEAQHDPARATAALPDYTLPLTGDGTGGVLVLHGIRDPRHGRQLAAAWPQLARVLADYGTAAGMDVIADTGRIGGAETPWPLLAAADAVVLVARPTLAGVDAARPRVDALTEHRSAPHMGEAERGGPGRVGLCLITGGAYTTAEVSRALSDLPVLAELPYAPADARVLSDGARSKLTFRTGMLMRAAARLGRRLRRPVEERAFTQMGGPPPAFGGDPR